MPLGRGLRADLATVAGELDLDVDPAVLARAVMLWSVLIGAVSLEVFGQYGQDTFAEPPPAVRAPGRLGRDRLDGPGVGG